MFEELIWHGEDIVRRLDAERALNPAERASYPDYERVPIGEAEVWRKEVERRIGDVAGAYALSRYEATRQQLRREIDQQTDTELDRWSRWYQRVLSLLRGLQRQYGGEPAPSVADAPSVVQQLSSDAKPAEYDVALSFAGEDRPLAGKLAGLLHARHIRVFYDEYEKASLWGKDLYQHLNEVYQKQARYCVIFLSASYRAKLWTNHELKSAQARAFAESREYILPVRLDDTEVPGVLETAAYIDLRSTEVEKLADLLEAKLASTAGKG